MNWIQQLAHHVQKSLQDFPDEEFSILFHIAPPFEQISDELLRVMRWFQIHPRITVGIYCAQSETNHVNLLESLNRRGFPHRLHFTSANLYIHSRPQESLANAAIQHLQKTGNKILAIFDSDRRNLELLIDRELLKEEITLLLQPNDEPSKIVDSPIIQGSGYNLMDLMNEHGLPKQIDYCWHGINDRQNLQEFLKSKVEWGEVDVRRNPETKELMTRHDSYRKSPKVKGEQEQSFEECLRTLKANHRKVKVDFKQGANVIDQVAGVLNSLNYRDDELWFHGDIHKLYPRGFKKLRRLFPHAIIQTTMDGFNTMILRRPRVAHRALKTYTRWGVNRFLLTWQSPNMAQILAQMDDWGYEVNFYEIPDLQNFLQAVLMLPAGITSDYNFPEWHRYGRGSGQDLKWHIYSKASSVPGKN